MISFNTTYKNNYAVVVLEGQATIQVSEHLKQEFLQVLKKDVNIHLEMKKLEKVDITFLQIIESLCLTLKKQGKKLIYDMQDDSSTVFQTSQLLGLFKIDKCHAVTEERCHLYTESDREKGE